MNKFRDFFSDGDFWHQICDLRMQNDESVLIKCFFWTVYMFFRVRLNSMVKTRRILAWAEAIPYNLVKVYSWSMLRGESSYTYVFFPETLKIKLSLIPCPVVVGVCINDSTFSF